MHIKLLATKTLIIPPAADTMQKCHKQLLFTKITVFQVNTSCSCDFYV